MALVALFVGGTFVQATPTPPPGPGCVGKVPISNQSGPTPQCPLLPHDAQCKGAGRMNGFHSSSKCHGENGVVFVSVTVCCGLRVCY